MAKQYFKDIHSISGRFTMTEKVRIQIDKKTLDILRTLKEVPRQTYNDLILKVVNEILQNRTEDLHDGFLRDIQQKKMRELWGDAENDAWDIFL